MKPSDLIETARDLTRAKSGKPRQASLRRATSTTYYALFHCLARNCADVVVGGRGADRSKPAWRQVYRALQHGRAKTQCQNQKMVNKFPVEIQDFAGMFVEMQHKRHRADYDPDEVVYKSAVLKDIDDAEDVLIRFQKVPVKHRRAFAVYVLLELRRN